MNQKIVLSAPNLHFISTGTGKMHARNEYQSFAYTLCGRLIPSGTQPQVTRKLAPDQLCKQCYKSLSAFTHSVTIESEATAP